MKEILILEDKKAARDALIQIVKEVDPNAVIYAFAGEEEAYAAVMKRSIDLFLVDIILHPEIMGDQSGAYFAQNIRTIEKYRFTPIVILTSLYDPKMHMYASVHCYRFIEKPFDREKVRQTVWEAMKYHTPDKRDQNIIFHMDGLLQMIPVREIVYIQSREHVLNITTIDDNFTIPNKSCKVMLEELDCEDFTKCNRGTIVNLSYIKKVDSVNRYIYLKGSSDVLQIGSIMKKSFMDKLLKHNENKYLR
ncbi:MAG: response regulator transcription factor [Eubacterium sp.]|nr:response regulator transcription factor [Eubacterium sp.]